MPARPSAWSSRSQAMTANLAQRTSPASLWRAAGRHARFRLIVGASVAITTVIMIGLLYFLRANEARVGVVLPDPLLVRLPAHDLSVPIFIVEYGSLLWVVLQLRRHPLRLPTAVLGYGLVMLMRLITVWVTPLDPPKDFIMLVDPIVSLAGGGTELTRDLFFSGHTAAMFIFAFASPHPKARWALGGAGIIVATMLLIQRAHYTVDVVVAPAMSLAAWTIARRSVLWFWRHDARLTSPTSELQS